MIAKLSRGALAAFAAVSLASLLAAAPAAAQPFSTEPDAGSVAGVNVYAPRTYARQPTTGAEVRLDRVSMIVSLSDLDLSRRGDAREAKRRIDAAAREVCDRADTLYPDDSQIPGGCRAVAVRDALRQAQAQAGYPILAWGYR